MAASQIQKVRWVALSFTIAISDGLWGNMTRSMKIARLLLIAVAIVKGFGQLH